MVFYSFLEKDFRSHIIIQDLCSQRESRPQNRGIDKILSGRLLFNGNLFNQCYHCRAKNRHYELQVVREQVPHLLLKVTLQKCKKRWTSLQCLEVHGCVLEELPHWIRYFMKNWWDDSKRTEPQNLSGYAMSFSKLQEGRSSRSKSCPAGSHARQRPWRKILQKLTQFRWCLSLIIIIPSPHPHLMKHHLVR